MFVYFLMTLRLLGWASIFLLKQMLVNVYHKTNNPDLQGLQPVFSSFFQICISQIPFFVSSYDHRLYSENKAKVLWQFKMKALISRFWINFTIIIRNSLSGRFPISSPFVLLGGHLSFSFTFWVVLYLFILFILLSLGWPLCILAVCGVLFIVEFPSCGWGWTGGLLRFPG